MRASLISCLSASLMALLLTSAACHPSSFSGGTNNTTSPKAPAQSNSPNPQNIQNPTPATPTNPSTNQTNSNSKKTTSNNTGNNNSNSSGDDDILNEGGDDASQIPSPTTPSTNSGGQTIDCNTTAAILDAAATYTFPNIDTIRDIVNQHCKTGISANFNGSGSVGSDPVTAEAVCNLKGYKSATVVKTGKYSTPHDNFIAYWDKAQSKFLLVGASGRNSNLQILTCTGKFKTQCSQENKLIDCVF